MSTFYISAVNTPTQNETFITSFNFSNTIKEIQANHDGCTVCIIANHENAYSSIKTAEKFKTKIEINGEKLDFSKDFNQIDMHLQLFKYSTNAEQAASELNVLFEKYKKLIPKAMTQEQAIEIMRLHCPNVLIDGQAPENYLSREFKQIISCRYADIKEMISTDDIKLLYLNEYDDCFASNVTQHCLKVKNNEENGQIIILGDGCGRGKTKNGTKRIFEKAKKQGLHPIMASGKQAISFVFGENDDHYQRAKEASQEFRDEMKGLCVVVNSLFSGKFDKILHRCDLLILEEIEDTMSHLISTAAGKLLNDRAVMVEKLITLLRQSKTIVIADAACSKKTLNLLTEMTGYDVIKFKQTVKDCVKKELYIYPNEEHLVQEISDHLVNKRNAITFSDAGNNLSSGKFDTLFAAFSAVAPDTFRLDAAVLKQMDKTAFWGIMNEEMAKHQHVLCSPVITAGQSITNGHFSLNSFLGHQTILPTQAMQTIARNRTATAAHVSITGMRSLSTVFDVVLSNVLEMEATEDELSEAVLAKYKKNEFVKIIIDRMIFENKMRIDYTNTFLIICELMGYQIIRVPVDIDLKKRGQKALDAAKKEEQKRKIAGILSAEKITAAKAVRMQESINTLSVTEQHQLASYELRKFYGLPLTESLILFDKGGYGRFQIDAMHVANGQRARSDKAQSTLSGKIITTILEKLGVIDGAFTNHVTATQLHDAYDFIQKGTLKSNGRTIKVVDKLKSGVNDFRCSKFAKKSVNSLLDRLFSVSLQDTVKQTADKQRIYEFKLTPRHHELRDLYNEMRGFNARKSLKINQQADDERTREFFDLDYMNKKPQHAGHSATGTTLSR